MGKKEKKKKKQISAILIEDCQVKFNYCTFHLELARWPWASSSPPALGVEEDPMTLLRGSEHLIE